MPSISDEKKAGLIRAAPYLRVSTDKQDFERQKDGLKKWFAENPTYAKVEQDYCDFAQSGGGFSRKALNRMLTHAQARQFEVVVSYGLDRIGRRLVESINFVKKLKEAGIIYIDAEKGLVYGKDDSTDFIMHTLWGYAELELATTTARIQSKMDWKKAELAKYGCKLGSPSILENWVESPIPVREDKKGLAVKPCDRKKKRFVDMWNEGITVRNMASMFRYPVNILCDHCKGNPPKDMEVTKVMAQKCRCGRCTSEKTIHMTRKKLGLPQRNPHSFGASKHAETPEEYTVDWNA